MTAGQRRTRDLIGIALFILLLAFLFWPSGDEEPDADASPDGVAEHATPTIVPTESADRDNEIACEPGDAARVLNSWVGAVNAGDVEALASMFPETGAVSAMTTTYPSMDQQILHNFIVHESGQMTDPGEVIDYLETRQSEYGERWRIDDVEIQRMGRSEASEGPELDRLSVVFRRSAEDLPDHEIHGEIIVNCHENQILMVDLTTDEPDLALPIPVEEFLATVGPYGTGEMRDIRMLVSTDLREDTGSLMQWDLRRIEANSMSGNYVENVNVQTMNGNEILQYIYDGRSWYLDHRGWREVGSLTGWDTLPLEIMMARREPSTTANILRDHLDDIPDEGSVTLSGELEVREELQRAAALVPRAEAVDGMIEVDIEDGNIVRTRYRLQDRQLGWHSNVPEIRWLHIHRHDRYDPQVFSRPNGFDLGAQQLDPPPDLAGQMELITRLDHEDGIGELYSLDHDGELLELLVAPSRGFSHEQSRGDDWPMTWQTERRLIGDLTVILAGPDQDAFPEAVLWDTRQFRYELRFEPGALGDSVDWDESPLREIIVAFLRAEQSDSGWRRVGP